MRPAAPPESLRGLPFRTLVALVALVLAGRSFWAPWWMILGSGGAVGAVLSVKRIAKKRTSYSNMIVIFECLVFHSNSMSIPKSLCSITSSGTLNFITNFPPKKDNTLAQQHLSLPLEPAPAEHAEGEAIEIPKLRSQEPLPGLCGFSLCSFTCSSKRRKEKG